MFEVGGILQLAPSGRNHYICKSFFFIQKGAKFSIIVPAFLVRYR